MRINSLFLLACCAWAQQAPVMRGVNSITNGVHVAYGTVVEPAGESGTKYKLSGGVIVHQKDPSHRGVHRYVRTGDSYFGYDVFPERVNGGTDIRIRIEPLTLTAEDVSRLLDVKVQVGSLPKFPAPLVVSAGSTIELEILRNEKTGQRVVDLLTVYPAAVEKPLRWALKLVEPVATAGKLTASGAGTLEGDLLSFQIPRQGTFTLSLLALRSHGFQLVGEVDWKVIRFKLGGETFEVVSKENVVPGGGKWNIYGRLTPKNVGTELVIGTSDL